MLKVKALFIYQNEISLIQQSAISLNEEQTYGFFFCKYVNFHASNEFSFRWNIPHEVL